MVKPLVEAGHVCFKSVYIREAHAVDEWNLNDATLQEAASKQGDDVGVCFRQPKTLKQRVSIARMFLESEQLGADELTLLVDSMDDEASRHFEAAPERLYILNRDCRVVYRSGLGPFDYDVDALGKKLSELLAADTHN
jgi:Iodothyronine deiodinase